MQRRQWHPTPVLLPGKSHGQRSLVGCSPWGHKESTRLNNCTFTFHFHASDKEVATHSSVLAWRIPGMGEPGGQPSMGSHRVGHDWSDLAAAAASSIWECTLEALLPLLDWLAKDGHWPSPNLKRCAPWLTVFRVNTALPSGTNPVIQPVPLVCSLSPQVSTGLPKEPSKSSRVTSHQSR